MSAGFMRTGALAGVAAAMLGLAGTARAESGSGTALKNTAIAGTVASWAVALFKGAPAGACLVHGNTTGPGAAWGYRLQGGKDKELSYGSIGLEQRECYLTSGLGFALDVSPVVSAGYWHADSDSLYSHHAFDVAYVPMLHWRTPMGPATRLDFQFGIGPAYLTASNIGDRQKGSNFQFSDHFGVGVGSNDGHWRVGFEFRHISNLDIHGPNNAVDFKGIALEWRP